MRLGQAIPPLVLATAAALSGCNRAPDDKSAPASPTTTHSDSSVAPATPGSSPTIEPGEAQRPNVLLISMDTTRADCLGCYGNRTIRTPNIDRLAQEGTLFMQCISPAPITLPSHTTMMTGLNPYAHGVRDNGAYFVRPEIETLAERFKEAGYTTGAQVSAFVLKREFGLDQGFDTYDDQLPAEMGTALQARAEAERPGDQTAERAVQWIHEHARDSTFQFVHFFDPHAPWRPAKALADEYPGEPYLAEIAFVDSQIGKLIEALTSEGRLDNTLMVLTADHGEGLNEHDEQNHGWGVYDATQRVPLILRWPGRIPAGLRLDPQVRLSDVAPTLLDLLDMPPLPEIQGTSLKSALAQSGATLNLPAYSETFLPHNTMGLAWLRALRAGGWKYIHAPTPELYDLTNDPHETTNLAAAQPERVAAMRNDLRGLLTRAPLASAAATRAITSAQRKQMESLNYVGGVPAPDTGQRNELEMFEPRGGDPRRHSGDVRVMARILALVQADDYEPAEALLRDLLARSENPAGFWWAHGMLGATLERLGRSAEAEAEFRAALTAQPGDTQSRVSLASALLAQDKLDEARSEISAALDSAPVFALTYHIASSIALRRGELPAALRFAEQAVALEPANAQFIEQLGDSLARGRRAADAAQQYRKALELAPRDRRARGKLADLLLALRKPQEALKEFEQLTQSDPNDARAWGGRGVALYALRQLDPAVENLTRATRLDPRLGEAWLALAAIHTQRKDYAAAAAAYESGLVAAPTNPTVVAGLGWLLATCPDESLREPDRARQLAEKLANSPAETQGLDILAAVAADQGDFSKAVDLANQAAALAQQRGQERLATEIRQRAALYQSGTPYRLP